MRTRSRLPAGATEAIGARMLVEGRVRLGVLPDRDVPGVDHRAHRPLGPGDRVDDGSVLEDDLGQAVPRARATPGIRLLPTKLATNASAGAASSCVGVPIWWILPSTITPTRSASDVASSKSWVTSRAGSRSSVSRSNSSARTRGARVGVERRERLVEEQHGRVAGERPGEADPLALAAGEAARPGVGEVGDAEALEQLVGARLARRRRRSGARSCAGTARTPGTRSPPAAPPAGGRRAARRRRASARRA